MPKIVFKDTVYGNSAKKANEVLIDKIEGSEAGDVQVAISELYQKLIASINDINEYKAQLDALLAGASSAYGFATLDENGKIPTSQLPSYVDDVEEVDTYSDLPTEGVANKIYYCKDTSMSYRWSGSTYVPIPEMVTLGETASTAFRGDKGKVAYEHAMSDHAPTTLATETSPGLMGALDRIKLDSLDKVREITYEEYEALSEEEKNNGTTYYVTDFELYGDYTVDNELNSESDNPISNKAVYNKFVEVEEKFGIEIIKTLSSGSTELIIENDKITTDSTVVVYTDDYLVSPTNVTVSDGSVTLTFKEQSKDVKVKVVVK